MVYLQHQAVYSVRETFRLLPPASGKRSPPERDRLDELADLMGEKPFLLRRKLNGVANASLTDPAVWAYH